MKKGIILSITLAALAQAFTGCSVADILNPTKGISFSTSYSGLQTKTSYSDGTIDNMYRIDWQVGDQMSIGSAQALDINKMDYVIASTRTDGYISYGTLDLAPGSSTGLRWKDNGKYYFYAAYPAGLSNFSPYGLARWRLPETQVQASTSGWSQDNSTFTAEEDGDYMLMAARCTVSRSTSSPNPVVDLPFKFLPTVFEFEISGVTDMTVREVKLSSSSVNLTGLLDCNIAQEDEDGYPEWTFINSPADNEVPSKSAKLCPKDGDESVTLEAGKKLNFHLFTAPSPITNLTFSITLATTSGDKTLSIELKKLNSTTSQYEFLSFAAHKKHRITGLVVPAGISIVVGEDVIMCPWTDENVDLY